MLVLIHELRNIKGRPARSCRILYIDTFMDHPRAGDYNNCV